MTRKKFDHMHGFSKVKYPPMENDDKSDRQILKETKPRQTEVVGVGPRDSVCGGCSISPDHHQGDDASR